MYKRQVQASELFKQSNTILLDGGMGTMLQASGLKLGAKPEELNITNPELIERDVYKRQTTSREALSMSFEFTLLDALQALRCPVLDALAVFFDQAGARGEIWIAFTAVLLAFRRTRRAGLAMALALGLYMPVSYTHLDVYKRQVQS